MTCFPSQTPKPHVVFPIHVIQSLSADNTLNICVQRGHSLLYCHNVLYPLSTTHCIIWTSSSETATEGPSTNQTVKDHWPVNVNNTSRTLRLDRLLNSILHLLSRVFFTRFPSSVPTNTITNLSILYPSPYLLSSVNLLASLIPSLLQDPISISTSCVLLAQQASALSNTQLLRNL